jgi:hypothetical protein
MRIILRAWSRIFFAVTVCCVLGAWYIIWADHRREVDRERLVWGPNADVPIFNPLDLFNFATMNSEAVVSYGLGALTGTLGLLCWFGGRKRRAESRDDRTSW